MEGLQSHVGQGRRPEGSFGPPAERTTRDGPDGARRDGRPPVGPPHPQLSPSPLLSPALSPRPAKSLAGKLPLDDDPFLASGGQDEPVHADHPQEKTADSNTEIATALSRLRSTVKRKEQQQQASATKAYTLSELNDMIDDAIEDHAADVPTETLGRPGIQVIPQPTLVRRSKSERSPRRSIDEVAFGPPDRGRQPTSSSRRHQSSDILARNPGQDWLPTRTSQNRARREPGLRSGSPVKQRAAIFETVHKRPEDTVQACEAPHDLHIHVKSEWSVVPLLEHTVDREKELHSWKFGKTIYDRSVVPSAVAPPDVKRHRTLTESSRETYSSFNTAEASPQRAAMPDEATAGLSGPSEILNSPGMAKSSSRETDISKNDRNVTGELSERTGSRNAVKAPPQRSPILDEDDAAAGRQLQEPTGKTSMSWLNRWKVFGKGSSAVPRTDEDVVEATPQRDEHYPTSGPSTVRSKVEELLRRDEDEQQRRQIYLERTSRPQSRRPSIVKVSEMRTALPEVSSLKPAQAPPLQVPAQEQAELMGTFPDTTSSSSSEAKGKGAMAETYSIDSMAPSRGPQVEKELPNVLKPRTRRESTRSSAPVKAPLQAPAEEQLQMAPTPQDGASTRSSEVEGGVTVPKTGSADVDAPIHRSWAEKEVLSVSKPQSRADSVRAGSPVKPTPSTPTRGRSAKMRQSRSPGGLPYTKEQAFVLSPVPSPSRSRPGSQVRTHRVEVEMRDSPEREARERGETIMIVRASNVMEQEED